MKPRYRLKMRQTVYSYKNGWSHSWYCFLVTNRTGSKDANLDYIGWTGFTNYGAEIVLNYNNRF